MTSLLDTMLASLVIYVAIGLIEFALQAALSNSMTSLTGSDITATRLENGTSDQVKFRGFPAAVAQPRVKFKVTDGPATANSSLTTVRMLLPSMSPDHGGIEHLMAATSLSRSCSPSVHGSIDQWMTSNSSLANHRSANFSETKV